MWRALLHLDIGDWGMVGRCNLLQCQLVLTVFSDRLTAGHHNIE